MKTWKKIVLGVSLISLFLGGGLVAWGYSQGGLTDLQNVNTINYSNQFFLETIIRETESYIELLEKGVLKISTQSFNLEEETILKERYGIPSKLIKRILNGKLENKDDNIPMNPLNKVIDMPTKNWIKALHGE